MRGLKMGLEAWRGLALMLLVTICLVLASLVCHYWPHWDWGRLSLDTTAIFISVSGLVVSAMGLFVSCIALLFSHRQANSGIKQAEFAERTYEADGAQLQLDDPEIAAMVATDNELNIASASISIGASWLNVGKRAAVNVSVAIAEVHQRKGESAIFVETSFPGEPQATVAGGSRTKPMGFQLFGPQATYLVANDFVFLVRFSVKYKDHDGHSGVTTKVASYRFTVTKPNWPTGREVPARVMKEVVEITPNEPFEL